MKNAMAALALGAAAAWLAAGVGCEDRNGFEGAAQAQSPESGGAKVAVLDLNAVAERTGVSARMQQAMQGLEQRVGQQLQANRQQAQQRIQSLARDMGEDPTDRQQAAFARERAALSQALNRAQVNAQRGVAGVRDQLGRSFGDAVRPMAKELAEQRGVEIILLAGGNMFSYDESVDLTEDLASKIAAGMEDGSFDWSPDQVFDEIRAAQQALQSPADGQGGVDGGGEEGMNVGEEAMPDGAGEAPAP